MDFVPPEIKAQIKDAAANAKLAILEASRHNKTVEAQNAEIIALLQRMLAELEHQ